MVLVVNYCLVVLEVSKPDRLIMEASILLLVDSLKANFNL